MDAEIEAVRKETGTRTKYEAQPSALSATSERKQIMNLYKMELYKILHRKSALITGVFIILWMAVYCSMLITDEHTCVDGADYYGYQAIQKDREITAEYEGIFTDEKAVSIIARYGFPRKVVRDFGGWQDSSYLTEFVTDHLSDGYMYGWNEGEYKIPKHVIPMAESDLGIYLDTGFPFAYAGGWQKLLDCLQLGALLLDAWLIILLSTLFSEERQTRMHALIRTSDRGITTDLWARISAAFTVCLIAGLLFCGTVFLLFKAVFGLSGGGMPAAIVLNSSAMMLKNTPVDQFTAKYVIMILGAFLMQTGICIWISSAAKSNFQAVVTNIIVWIVPPALFLCMRGTFLRLLSGCLPFLLVQYNNTIELFFLYKVQLCVLFMLPVLGILYGRKNWRTTDRE